jgi:hypothetical protein
MLTCAKSLRLKLSHVFAKYLYQQRILSLPGIGVFQIDPSVNIPETVDKNTPDFRQYIRYEQKPVQKPDEEFIDYIRVQTGKIKPLAESDLESFLSDGKLLLNIGKPFFIEGIGTLQKSREGVYEFSPGEPVIERLEGEKTGEKIVRPRPSFDSGYSQIEHDSNSSRKLLIAFGVVVGLTAIIWGGYALYNRNVAPLEAEKTTIPAGTDTSAGSGSSISSADTPLNTTDSSATVAATDSVKTAVPVADPGTYKFILETTTSKNRALKRIGFLNTLSPRMKLETADSSFFKIYVILPAAATDTSRIKDSLNAWYWGRPELKVSIEH